MNSEQLAFGGMSQAPHTFAFTSEPTIRAPTPATCPPSPAFDIDTASNNAILKEIYNQIYLIWADISDLTHDIDDERQAWQCLEASGQTQFNSLVSDIGTIDGQTTRIENML